MQDPLIFVNYLTTLICRKALLALACLPERSHQSQATTECISPRTVQIPVAAIWWMNYMISCVHIKNYPS